MIHRQCGSTYRVRSITKASNDWCASAISVCVTDYYVFAERWYSTDLVIGVEYWPTNLCCICATNVSSGTGWYSYCGLKPAA